MLWDTIHRYRVVFFYETDQCHKSLGAFLHSLSFHFISVPSTKERNEEKTNTESSVSLGQYALPLNLHAVQTITRPTESVYHRYHTPIRGADPQTAIAASRHLDEIRRKGCGRLRRNISALFIYWAAVVFILLSTCQKRSETEDYASAWLR